MQAEKGVLVLLFLKKMCDWNNFSDLPKRFASSVGLLVFAYIFISSSLLVSSIFLAFIYAVLIYEWHCASLKNKKIIDTFVLIFITLGIFSFSFLNLMRYETSFFFEGIAAFIPMILVVLTAIITDTGAYFVGRIVGGYRPFAIISPGKTISGYIGGLIFGGSVPLITVITVGKTLPNVEQIFYVLLIGVCLAVGVMAGDLLQSYFKRCHNIKDTGKILPGHGGLFDRFDGILGASLMLFVIFLCYSIIEQYIS
jgi:phosphatidate cytidylyltransferase